MKFRSTSAKVILILIIFSLACNSAGPISTFFATPTLTPTITPSATPTITPSPTPTLTTTPLPTGVVTEKSANGEKRVVDYDSGYYLVLSKDWLPIEPNSESLKEAMEAAGEENPELQDAIGRLDAVLQNDSLRLLAFNVDKKYRSEDFFTNLVVISFKDSIVDDLPLDLFIELNVEDIKKSNKNGKVTESGVAKNKNNLSYGYIMLDNSVEQSGRTIKIQQFIVAIKANGIMNLFNLTVPSTTTGDAKELYQEFLDSVFLLEKSTVLSYLT